MTVLREITLNGEFNEEALGVVFPRSKPVDKIGNALATWTSVDGSYRTSTRCLVSRDGEITFYGGMLVHAALADKGPEDIEIDLD